MEFGVQKKYLQTSDIGFSSKFKIWGDGDTDHICLLSLCQLKLSVKVV